MTGRIAGIKRFAVHDGDGIRTTVFFKGCSLRCVWCHNPECIRGERESAWFRHLCTGCGACVSACPNGALEWTEGSILRRRERCNMCGACASVCPTGAQVVYGSERESGDLAAELAKDLPFFRASGGGVTLSGGECLTQADFAAELAANLRERDIPVAIDTCGAVPWEAIEKVLPFAGLFLYDIKAIDQNIHRMCTGRENREILQNLDRLCERGVAVEIRYPLVVGWNDGEASAIGSFLKGRSGIRGVRVLQYHNLARSRYEALGRKDTMPRTVTDSKAVETACAAIRAYGVNAFAG